MEWLRYQIRDISRLIDTPEVSDWMDSSVGRRGKIFYTKIVFIGKLLIQLVTWEERRTQGNYFSILECSRIYYVLPSG